MKTVKTIDEVKKHFKNAKEVRCVYTKSTFDISNPLRKIHRFNFGFWVDTEEQSVKLYSETHNELAEIISYKSNKEKTQKKELKALLNLAKECLEKPNSEVCQTYKDKILDACPSLKGESDVLEVGQWYKQIHQDGSYIISCYQGENNYHYGFSAYGVYSNALGSAWYKSRTCKIEKADPKKVEELLIAEAKKRGFKNRVHIDNSILGFTHNEIHKSGSKMFFDGQWLNIGNNGLAIFGEGKWATISETISLSEAEKIIGKKIKID